MPKRTEWIIENKQSLDTMLKEKKDESDNPNYFCKNIVFSKSRKINAVIVWIAKSFMCTILR